ncbi:MAG: HDIG domain-containing protein [Dehalococcoidia bacterium]|nr:HDIG domain-containing protein [Dehalococcoidia bacterium]MDZ4278695.1 HDIG domain-containing protein [Dehalococcoidia bacterium]
MDRSAAWDLLCEYTQGEGLRKHGLAVEAVMRHFARKHGEDEDAWGVVGLIHDFDYERFPDEHPQSGAAILRERHLPEQSVQAVLAHGDHLGIPRETLMAKTLYAVDELAGFVTAVALVRPNKSLFEVEPGSVRKKMKDKAFARSVNRDDIVRGAEELGVDLDAHIAEVIEAMKPVAASLGLAGS